MIGLKCPNRSRVAATVVVVCGLLACACASGPRPQALQDANTMLSTQESHDLQADKPRLLQEARQHLASANEAYEDGEGEEAELHAHVAMNRLRTARNLADASAARKLALILKRRQAGATVDEDEEGLSPVNVTINTADEQRRFDRLEDRIDRIHAELRRSEGDSPELLSAKRALAKARRKQSQAIGADAPRLATAPYREGVSHIENAIESLELAIYSESRLSSEQAVAAFARAIQEAGQAPKPSQDKAEDRGGREQAEEALTQAARARAGALAAGARETNPAVFQQGESLYGSARDAFDRDDYRGTRRLALDAVRSFEEAAATAGAKRTTALGTAASGYGSVIASPERIEALIVALRFKRAEMLGTGEDQSCPATFKEFEAIVDLAQERLRLGDHAHAGEFAIRAQERVRRCETGAKLAQLPAKAEDETSAREREQAARALERAQSELARALSVNADDPKVRQGETLLRNAESWFDRGSYRQAEKLAETAERALRTVRAMLKTEPSSDVDVAARTRAAQALAQAQTLMARAQDRLGFDDKRLANPERRIERAEELFDDDRYAETTREARAATKELRRLLRARPKEPAKKAPTEPSEAERRAVEAIDRAQEAQVEALVRVTEPARLRKPDQLLALAKQSLDRRKFWQATDQANKARRAYEQISGKPTPRPKPPAKEKDVCDEAKRKLRTNMTLARSTEGDHLSEREARRHEEATGLLRSAERRLDRDECPRALEQIEEAADLLMDLPYRPGARPPGERPGVDEDEEPDEEWQAAYDAAQRALRARSRARRVLTSKTRPTYRKGLALLKQARDDYEDKAYDDALQNAKGALRKFNAVITAADDPDVDVVEDEDEFEPRKKTTKKRSKTTKKRSKTTKKLKAQPWRRPYYEVYEALAMRDKAIKAAASPEHDEAIERGKARLRKAERAWEDDDWGGAAKLARSAMKEFRKVLDEAEDKGKPSRKKVGKATYEQADAAVREAKVVLQVCERDKCEDRDFQEFTRAKEMVASAEQNLTDKRYGYAVQLARDARDKLSDILGKPRKGKPAPKVDPAAKRAAEDAIRDAEVQRTVCVEKRDCRSVDLEAFLHAQKDLSAAKSALADGDVDRAKRLADKARAVFESIKASGPKFVIPPGIQSVTRSGDQLYLNPPIKFGSGQSQLQGASQQVVQDLAAVLKQNADQISSVQILGFTDSRGNAAVNKRISGARALSVQKALVGAGVPSTLLSSEGRGPDNPIADNGTPEGRAANRRVEVHFQMK